MASVSSQLIRRKVDLIKKLGVDTKDLLTSCNITEYEINDSFGRIPSEQYFSFLNKTKKYNNEIVKYDTTHRMDSIFLPLFGLCLNSPTPLDAVKNFITYRGVIGDTDCIKANYRDNELLIEYETDLRCNSKSSSSEGNFVILYNILNSYIEASNLDVKAFFSDHAVINPELLNSKLNTSSKYNQSKNQLLIKSNQLNIQSNHFNNKIYALQKSNARNLINFNNNIDKKQFSTNVEKIITNLIYTCQLDIDKTIFDQVCHVLNMSRWTINNRLREENTSFTHIVKNVRIKISCDLLINTDKSIQEISDITHFSSLANFSRFFSSHMNQSPKQYRLSRIIM